MTADPLPKNAENLKQAQVPKTLERIGCGAMTSAEGREPSGLAMVSLSHTLRVAPDYPTGFGAWPETPMP